MTKCLMLFAVLTLVACQPEEGPAGPPGPPGPKGDTGEQGPAGDDGSGLSSTTRCDAIATFGTLRILVGYAKYVFSDGSVMVTCEIRDASGSYTGTQLWPTGVTSAKEGICFMGYDVDTFTSGSWRFAHPEGNVRGVSAVYSDPGSPNSGRSVALTCF